MAARDVPRHCPREGILWCGIYFWNGSGFSADAVYGKIWGVKGRTPVVERPGQRQSISAASAVNAKGACWYCTYEGALNAELFVTLLRRILQPSEAGAFGGGRIAHPSDDAGQGLCRIEIWPAVASFPGWLCGGTEPR
jgi:hypothetical protein